MKKLFLFLFLFLLGYNAFAVIVPIESTPMPGNDSLFAGQSQWPERYHDNSRTMRYPRAEHELFLNPPPLILPSSAKTDSVQFSLSRSLSFPNDTNTITSNFVPWAISNPHKLLTPGQWYWRYRDKSKTGVVGSWSKVDTFTVKAETPKFVTPPLSRMLAGIPTGYPRLFAYLQAGWEKGRSTISRDPEYRDLVGRTTGAMTTDYTTVLPVSTRLINMNAAIMYFLFPAYVLTGDVKYKNRLVELVRHVLTLPDPTQADNGVYKQFMTLIYDQCYNEFTADERSHIERILVSLLQKETGARFGLECHVYENHGMQYDIVDKFRTAVVLYGKHPIAREYLQYCYDTWVGRAPLGGFVRDGGNFNGIGYFGIDAYSIHYMAGILSYYTGTDFHTHPWYQELGKVALYSSAPQSGTLGFGDGHSGTKPSSGWCAFMDLIARQTQDPYALWYVNTCGLEKNDYSLRMYRLGMDNVKPRNLNVALPANRPKALWLKDCGEAYIHSDIANTQNDLGLSLRASTYGSGSHCISDNNSFIMTYKGQFVYQNTGYYGVGIRHNLLSSRHTQAQNSILVDGIGQPMSTLDFANLARVQDGKNISYALGDASHAYAHLTDYGQWIQSFASQNITQTPEFGLGETSLKRFRRHVLMLHPDKVLIYDDLEAGTPVRWDWLLHSANQFDVQEMNKRIVLEKNTNPLSKIESGTIKNGCGTLSFDYVQSGSENVNLEVYVNNQLIKTISTTNEMGIVKQSGNITVNKSGDFTIQFRQKDASSGQVAIDNLKWSSYNATGVPDINQSTIRMSVKPANGSIEVTTNQGGQIKVHSVLGQNLAAMNVSEGQHLVRVTPGFYLVSFISGGKTETSKVEVK